VKLPLKEKKRKKTNNFRNGKGIDRDEKAFKAPS
jgi:hypothetical protein